MKLDQVVAWYQKKIGTYDKQPWEQTIEQRIIGGFVNVPSKNAPNRTEYIDVDLVRGSTFPKAKPKQSLLTILRLAVIRYLLLPLYAKWWMAQTSSRIFSFLLFLYVVQMMNWAIYSYNVNRNNYQTDNNESDTCTDPTIKSTNGSTEFTSITELLMPMALSLMLSVIHSQIVATSSNNLSNADNHKKGPVHLHRKKRERKKRRKSQSMRSRSSNISPSTNLLADTKPKSNLSTANNNPMDNIDLKLDELPENVQISQKQMCQHFNENIACSASASDSNCSPPQLRKRNVNWCSPIKSHSSQSTIARNSVKFIQMTENGSDHSQRSEDDVELMENQRNGSVPANTGADDDGFESLNGKSSSGEEMIAVRHSLVNAIDTSNHDNEIIVRNTNEQYGNSAYPTESYDENDLNNNSDNDLINGTTNVLENNCDKMNMRNLLTLKCARSAKLYNPRDNLKRYSTDEDEEDEIDGESQPSSPHLAHKPMSDGTSGTEWIGITTNSEECSYSSADNSGSQIEYSENNGCEWNDYFTPTVILNSNCAIGDRSGSIGRIDTPLILLGVSKSRCSWFGFNFIMKIFAVIPSLEILKSNL